MADAHHLFVSIPLGIAKAVRDGSRFDVWTQRVIIVGYAIPGFLFAILLVVLFAGGSFFNWFPLRGLTSDNFAQTAPGPSRSLDYLWHLVLPLMALVIGSFATMTLLTKNSFLDEIKKQYVMTARAKGLTRAARALRPCVPQRDADRHRRLSRRLHLGAFFPGALLIETIFSLDGLGFSATRRSSTATTRSCSPRSISSRCSACRDLISDLTYTWIDPRIDFEAREL